MLTFEIYHIGTKINPYLFEIRNENINERSSAVKLIPPSEVPVGSHNTNLQEDLHWYLECYLAVPHNISRFRADEVQEALKAWGSKCFSALFSGQAQTWFEKAHKRGLENLMLKIVSDDPDILAWPWEALFSEHYEFIAQQCHVVRQLTQVADPRGASPFLPRDELNILYIISRPRIDDISFNTLARPLIDFVSEGNWPVRIDLLRPPTFERLQDVLRKNPDFYHIVHFDGHGMEPTNNETLNSHQGMLVFEKEYDPDHEGDEISADILSSMLREYNVPYVVLNACQSATFGDNLFSSVATSILRAGVRGVVAMSYSLWVEGAKAFIPTFYKRLLESSDVSEAIRAGRKNMFSVRNRDPRFKYGKFYDWIVPVLYQQTTTERILPKLQPDIGMRKNRLPEEVLKLQPFDFIGRADMLKKLERAMCHKQPAILIYGMAGEGKTTLAKGFLHWLNATGGLSEDAIWFNFGGIYSVKFVVDILIKRFTGTQSQVDTIDQKIDTLGSVLRNNSVVMVWDNFEFASNSSEVNKFEDIFRLRDLLNGLRGGKTKVIITSNSKEEWLNYGEYPLCVPLKLDGMHGNDLWAYCNSVLGYLDIPIKPNDLQYMLLFEKFNGHPLAIRAALMSLGDRTVEQLLSELENDKQIFDEDNENTGQLMKVLSVFGRALPDKFAPILRFIGLHEQFVDIKFVESVFKALGKSTDDIPACFEMLVRAGLCHEAGYMKNSYIMHPVVHLSLSNQYPASEAEKREYVDWMGWLFGEFAERPLKEQKLMFMKFGVNFRNASKIAKELDMLDHLITVEDGNANFAYKSKNYIKAKPLYRKHLELAEMFHDREWKAIALHQLGIIARSDSKLDEAEDLLNQSLSIELELKNEIGAAATYFELGTIAKKRRDFDSAEKRYKQALDISIKMEDESYEAKIYYQLGILEQERGKNGVAEKCYKKAWEIWNKLNDEDNLSKVYYQFGSNAYDGAHFSSANNWCIRALEKMKKLQDKYGEAMACSMLGNIAMRRGFLDEADRWYHNALSFYLTLPNTYELGKIYYSLGVLDAQRGDLTEAMLYVKEAIDIMHKYNDTYYEKMFKENLRSMEENSRR